MNNPFEEKEKKFNPLEALDGVQSAVELAEGMRAMMEGRGWSPHISEMVSANFLNTMLTNALNAADLSR